MLTSSFDLFANFRRRSLNKVCSCSLSQGGKMVSIASTQWLIGPGDILRSLRVMQTVTSLLIQKTGHLTVEFGVGFKFNVFEIFLSLVVRPYSLQHFPPLSIGTRICGKTPDEWRKIDLPCLLHVDMRKTNNSKEQHLLLYSTIQALHWKAGPTNRKSKDPFL